MVSKKRKMTGFTERTSGGKRKGVNGACPDEILRPSSDRGVYVSRRG